ncbi:MAG: LysM peptidoglycan-binding domain-containing protein [Anaerolineae bacterium]|nr:MAG: LysM peptidoglycan-binding domain-containing protein [Anaerolineae bacterium]
MKSWLYWLSWGIALVLLAVAALLAWQRFAPRQAVAAGAETATPLATAVSPAEQPPALPPLAQTTPRQALYRRASLKTEIPDRPRYQAVEYTVKRGDSVFGIAAEFGLEPETVLWANYDVLKDDPHSLSPGMVLRIPPTDGVYYQWEEGDTLQSVADAFEADVDDIVNWIGNDFDLTDPQVEPGQWVMVPGGHREFQQWIVPVPARGMAGVSTGVYGSGACSVPSGGLYGSGAFIWPTTNHTLSGNDYWSGHLAIDIGVGIGDPIVAADSGVVVFAGWATGGYGYTVAIDHGNGYQTLYAHNSSINVSCGQSVRQGQLIALGGSSGNSTGPHLHFEVRLNGGFVNPWYVLPAP